MVSPELTRHLFCPVTPFLSPFCPLTSTGSDKYHAANDFGMLVDETKKPEPRPGRIKRLFDSIKQLAPRSPQSCPRRRRSVS
jgi:hypothetical protein